MCFKLTLAATIAALVMAGTASATGNSPWPALLERLGLVEQANAEQDSRLDDLNWRIGDLSDTDYAILEILGRETDNLYAARVQADVAIVRCAMLPERREKPCLRQVLQRLR